MDSLKRWILINTIFLVLLVMGTFFQLEHAANLTIFTIWITALASIIAVNYPEDLAQKDFPVSQKVDLIYDGVVLTILVSFGWFVSAIIYVIHMICLDHIQRNIKNDKRESTTDNT